MKKVSGSAHFNNLAENNNSNDYNKIQNRFFEKNNFINNIFRSYRQFNQINNQYSIDSSKSFRGKKYCTTERDKNRKQTYGELKCKSKDTFFRKI